MCSVTCGQPGFLNLRSVRDGGAFHPVQSNTVSDQCPQKMLCGSHFDAALILINGLVAIGLHNGGPFGTARRHSMQREGAPDGKQY